MSNYQGRKTAFTPPVHTRYFEHTETPKSTSGHIHFDDDTERTSTNYQTKRDLIFKRLFPSKYANSNVKETEPKQIFQNGVSSSSTNAAQTLGDFIPLSNNSSSALSKQQSSAEPDIILSSSDEVDEDDLTSEQAFPTSTHESIVGHLHPRATIVNVRTILIRELYERTSDPHTEWLKCKMNIPQAYINPKYYADFQRRFRKDIERNTIKTKTSISKQSVSENGYHVLDAKTIARTTIQIDDSLESDSIIETSPTKSVPNSTLSGPVLLSTHSPKPSASIPEFIILDSDEDEEMSDDDATQSKYFIDRSSTSGTAISQPTTISNEEYHQEDSKYAQLPARNKASAPVIRPILSKSQRRKQSSVTSSSKPLVAAIDRIIDQMDQAASLQMSKKGPEEQNLLIKQMKKRKKKKKQKVNNSKSLIE